MEAKASTWAPFINVWGYFSQESDMLLLQLNNNDPLIIFTTTLLPASSPFNVSQESQEADDTDLDNTVKLEEGEEEGNEAAL